MNQKLILIALAMTLCLTAFGQKRNYYTDQLILRAADDTASLKITGGDLEMTKFIHQSVDPVLIVADSNGVFDTIPLLETIYGVPPTDTLTDSSSINWDLQGLDGPYTFHVTLSDDRFLSNPTNKTEGRYYTLLVEQDGTGNRILSYDTDYLWPAGTDPTLTTTAGAVDIVTFLCLGGKMYGVMNFDFR